MRQDMLRYLRNESLRPGKESSIIEQLEPVLMALSVNIFST